MSGYADLSRTAYISPNDLMASTRVNYYPQELQAKAQNDLLTNQQSQQQIGSADTEMAARIAQTLVATGDDAKAAQLYPGFIAEAQGRGFLKNAPMVWPGMEHAKRVAALGTPSADLYKTQQAAIAAQGLATALGGGGGAAAGGGSGTAPTAGAASLTPFVAKNLPPGITPEEDLLVRTASGEAADQGPVGQQAVAAVIRNRVRESGRSVSDVIFAANQFEPWNNPATRAKLEALDPNSREYQTILANLRANQADPTGGATHFYSPTAQKALGRQPPSWGNTDPSAVIGGHNFYRIGYKPGGGAPGAFPAAQQTVAAVAPPPQRVTTAEPETGLPVLTGGPPAAPGATAGGAQQPAPYQVASTQPTPPPTPPGTTPGTSAAPAVPAPLAPPTPTPPATPQMTPMEGNRALPAPPSAPALQSNGLTAQQNAIVQAALKMPNANLQQITSEVLQMQNQNRVAQQQAWSDSHPDMKFEMTGQGMLVLNPKTGQVVGHIPVTPNLQSRQGAVTIDPSTGKPARPIIQGDRIVGYTPELERPPTASFDLQKELHKRDTDELPKYNEQNQQAASNQIRIQQMRELIGQISTGAGGEQRANWANIAETMGWSDLAKRLVGMGGAAAAQEFAKYGLATAGAQERGDLGARGSLGAINLYKSANPGLELRPDANKAMLTAQLVAAQANRDYTQQAMDYVNRNGDAFVRGDKYTPLSHFDAEWAAARNPQIYAAAMGAINGDSWDKWTKALNMKSTEDVQRVIDIVRRADPTSTIMFKDNERHAVGTSQ